MADRIPSPAGWSRRQLLVATGTLGAGLATARGASAKAAGEKAGGGLVDRVADLEPLTADGYRQRIERARSRIAELGLGALFVEAETTLRYFTGVEWWPSERLFGVVIPRHGELAWICPAFEEGRARERISVGGEVRVWQENENPYQRLREALADRKLAGSLAVAPASRYFVFEGLRRELPSAGVVDGAPVVESCRGRKDAAEIHRMRLANTITEAAIAHAANGVTEGMTQDELAQRVRDAHVAQGVPPGWALVLFGPNAAYPHGTEAEVRLKVGDLVLMDCGSSVQGYQSDITRTFVFGRQPSDRQRRIWELVQRAQAAAWQAARPGVPCGEVDRAARSLIEEGGFGPGYTYFTHRLGHGIGMQGHEWPYLVQGSTVPLAPGMTMSDEPGIYVVGELGVRLEDILHITEDGCERLSTPMEEIEVVGA